MMHVAVAGRSKRSDGDCASPELVPFWEEMGKQEKEG